MRSPLGQARGLGSVHSGSGAWWASRVTSAALVPLTLWFIWSVISLAGQPRAAVVTWLSAPIRLALMLVLIVTTFYHLLLGLP